MDLRLAAAVPATAEEREAVDAVLGPPETGWEGGQRRAADSHVAFGGRAARSRRHLLIPLLHAVQEKAGWVSPGALDYICERLTVPPADAYGVASFYALFRTTPSPGAVVHVCDDVACLAGGAEELCEQMKRRFGDAGTEAAFDDAGVTWQRSPCLGQCDRGPAALIQRATGAGHTESLGGPAGAAGQAGIVGQADPVARTQVTPADPERIWQALAEGPFPEPELLVPQAAGPARSELKILSRVGQVDPASLGSYRAAGGYEMLRRALQLGPQGVLREVRDARLLGRGGAAFPTAVKWQGVTENPVRPHYVICNADESEPGTFKDRVLMEQDPYALVEAITIMGYACGAEQGYIYIRGEYPVAEARLNHAISQARAKGFLGGPVGAGWPGRHGADVTGEGFGFDIEVRRGAGAYIAGEETGLLSSLEGKRAEPRNKPPFPAQSGLFGKPTAINNVETLFSVLEVLRAGGPAYAQTGTERSTGTRLFCLSGHVEKPGLYEYEFGVTLGHVLEQAGGVRGGRPLQAILLGGAAGTFVGLDALGMPLTFEGVREVGATLGSGVVVVLDDTADVPELLRRIAQFFRDESCGQCVPCRVGTVRQEELLARVARGNPLGGDLAGEAALYRDIASVTRDASICGLGQTAVSAIESAIKIGLVPGFTPGTGRDSGSPAA